MTFTTTFLNPSAIKTPSLEGLGSQAHVVKEIISRTLKFRSQRLPSWPTSLFENMKFFHTMISMLNKCLAWVDCPGKLLFQSLNIPHHHGSFAHFFFKFSKKTFANSFLNKRNGYSTVNSFLILFIKVFEIANSKFKLSFLCGFCLHSTLHHTHPLNFLLFLRSTFNFHFPNFPFISLPHQTAKNNQVYFLS